MTESANAVATASAGKRARRKLLLRLLLGVIVLAAITWSLWYFLEGRWYADTEDAYVHGNIVQVSARVPGTVIRIDAEDGDFVQAGQVLVTLDPSDADVALQAAKAKLAQAVRQVRGMNNDVAAAKAEVDARRTALDKARADYHRRRGLAKSGAISAEMLAHAADALAAAQSALTAAEQGYRNARTMAGEGKIAANPLVKAAKASLRAAWLDRVHTTLLAPVDGHVAKRVVQVGEHVLPGRPLLAVIPLDTVWVEANFKETQLQHMRIGQPVTLVSDLYGDEVTYHGKLTSLGIGTGSAFSLLPAQNATGNWIKIVQRVPVRVALQKSELDAHPLRIGLSMTATVDLHDRSGPLLSRQPTSGPRYSTQVYARQLAEADALIARIIAANLEQPAD